MRLLVTVFAIFLFASCQTDTFDFDKLSSQTGLTPEVRLPVGQIELEAQAFLDSLDLVVDYNRDDYGTIYLMENFSEIGSVTVEDVFDVKTLSTTFLTTYNLGLLEVADTQNSFDPIRIEEVTSIPDQSTLIVPSFTTFLDLGTATLFEETFSQVTFSSGMLTIDFTNNFPVAATLSFDLMNADGQVFVQSTPVSLDPGMSTQQQINLTGVELSQTIQVQANISSAGSTGLVTIDYASQNILLQLGVSAATVSKATLSAPKSFDYDFTQEVSFGSDNDVKLRQLNLKEAVLDLEIENEFGFAAFLSVQNANASVDGSPFEQNYSLTPSSSLQDFEWLMDNVELNFEENAVSGDSEFTLDFQILFTLQAGQVIETDRQLVVKGSFGDLVLDTAFGDFGESTHTTEEITTINDSFDDFFGKLKIFEPRIDVLVHNTFGVPAKFSTAISAFRKDMTMKAFEVDTAIEERIIEAPAQLYDTATTRLSYDHTNSNIEEFIAFLPDDEIRAELTLTTNPSDVSNTENFLTKDSKFWLDAVIEAPVHFNIDNFSMQDTISLSPPLADEDVDQVLEAALFINYTSELPIELELHTQMIDTLTQTVLTSFDPLLIAAAPTNEAGEVISPAQGTTTLQFASAEIDALKKGNGIAMEIVANSTEKESKNAKLSGDASVKLDVAASIKIDLDE